MRKRLAIIVAFLVGGCTAADIAPDRLSIGTTVDADTYRVHSYSVQVQWHLRQP